MTSEKLARIIGRLILLSPLLAYIAWAIYRLGFTTPSTEVRIIRWILLALTIAGFFSTSWIWGRLLWIILKKREEMHEQAAFDEEGVHLQFLGTTTCYPWHTVISWSEQDDKFHLVLLDDSHTVKKNRLPNGETTESIRTKLELRGGSENRMIEFEYRFTRDQLVEAHRQFNAERLVRQREPYALRQFLATFIFLWLSLLVVLTFIALVWLSIRDSLIWVPLALIAGWLLWTWASTQRKRKSEEIDPKKLWENNRRYHDRLSACFDDVGVRLDLSGVLIVVPWAALTYHAVRSDNLILVARGSRNFFVGLATLSEPQRTELLKLVHKYAPRLLYRGDDAGTALNDERPMDDRISGANP